jgi:hypothetical protein
MQSRLRRGSQAGIDGFEAAGYLGMVSRLCLRSTTTIIDLSRRMQPRLLAADCQEAYAVLANSRQSRIAACNALYFCRNPVLRAAPLSNAQGPGSWSPGWRTPPCGMSVPRSTRTGAFGFRHND